MRNVVSVEMATVLQTPGAVSVRDDEDKMLEKHGWLNQSQRIDRSYEVSLVCSFCITGANPVFPL